MRKWVIAIEIALFIILLVFIISTVAVKYYRANNSEVSDNGTTSNASWVDANIETPEGYTKVDNKNIESETNCVVEGLFFTEVEGEDKTLVTIHVQNRGDKPFSKDAVCTISFYDANDNLLHRIGGVIEEGSDLSVGGRTIIKTQFLAKPGNIAKAVVGFENMN